MPTTLVAAIGKTMQVAAGQGKTSPETHIIQFTLKKSTEHESLLAPT